MIVAIDFSTEWVIGPVRNNPDVTVEWISNGVDFQPLLL